MLDGGKTRTYLAGWHVLAMKLNPYVFLSLVTLSTVRYNNVSYGIAVMPTFSAGAFQRIVSDPDSLSRLKSNKDIHYQLVTVDAL